MSLGVRDIIPTAVHLVEQEAEEGGSGQPLFVLIALNCRENP